MSEDALEIKNTQNPRCPICHLPELCQYDKELFFRRMTFSEFCDKANLAGYVIPESDFRTHMMRHIYVYKAMELPEDITSENILASMIGALHTQLTKMEENGETSEPEYTKKSELMKSMLELRGKFEGAYSQKSDLSRDFKQTMSDRLKESLNEGNYLEFAKFVGKRQQAIDDGNSEKPADGKA